MRHKSLHESAAEILAASVAAAGKEPVPMAAMMDPNADLGGESMMGDVTSPGAATAQAVMPSPKPGRPGAPAENMKALPAEGEEESEEEEKEESPEAMNEELVVLNEEQMLLFEQAIDAEFDVLVESIVTEFKEQEFTEEEFKTLQEQSSQFIAEMETLTEEEFEQYLATLTEEEFVHVIQLASLDEGFFSKVGKFLKKGVKTVAKVVSKVAPIASFIPGVGTALGAIGGKIAGKLAGTALGKLAGGAAGLVSKVGSAISKVPVVGGALKTAAGEALKGGVGSVLAGGKFKEGAKAAGLGSIVGSAAGAVGDAVSRATGSQVAGDVASNLAASRVGGSGGTNYNEKPERPDDYEPSQQDDQGERTQASAAAPQDDEDESKSFMRDVRANRRGRLAAAGGMSAMREDAQEIVGYLSTLNEQQLDQFISQLSDEEAEFVSEILDEAAGKAKKNPYADVMKLNPNIKDPNKIRAGDTIKLPDGKSYKISKGDTLSGILARNKPKPGPKPVTTTPAAPVTTTPTAPAAPAAPVAATPAAPAPSADNKPPRAPKTRAGEEDWSKQSTWDAWTLGKEGSAGSEADVSDSGSGMPTAEVPEKEKTVGDQFVDQIKRTGRSAIRAGIGGAILGQDWKDAAKAGAVGNLVGDIAKGFKQAKKQNMKEQFEDSNMNGEEQTMETNELTEEQVREQRMVAIKETVKQFKGNMREDVDALFNGESLSEEFRAKATLIFESAVTSRVETILEQIVQQNDEVLANAYDEIKNDLTEQVDEYLNYVVEQWMEQNQVAIETGLRAELAEDFISGLRALFQEHYIEIPEEKVDVAETLAAELETAAEYVDSVHQHVEQQNETISALQEELNAVKKEKAINNFCEGLTAVQAGKMKSLAEGVEFTTEGDFEEKLAVLRENYFPTKVQVKSEVKELQKVALNEEPEVASTNNIMNRYVQAIAKTAPKA